MWRWIIVALISVAVAFAFIGCGGKQEEPKKEVKATEAPKPPEPPKPEPKPFDPVGKWTGTLDNKPWSIEFTKDAKDPNKIDAKGYTDIKCEGDTITFKAKKIDYAGTWDGIKEELTIKWKEKDKDMSVVVKKEMAPAPTTEPVKKEEPKKEGKK